MIHVGLSAHLLARFAQVFRSGRSVKDKGCAMMTDYTDIITLEPGKRSGKPCIRGLRVTVYDVLSYLAAGMTTDEILEDFPALTHEDILACLSYAAERERHTLVVKS